MEVIPPERFPERNARAFVDFLTYCQEVARKKKRPQLASVCLRVKHIDPLAVLESIYEEQQLHFYLERPQDEEALAGAEAVVEGRFSGQNRFTEVREFAADISENTIAVGDLGASSTGPKFFCAFTFEEDVSSEEAGFHPATVFVPRWQVERRGGAFYAVANTLIAADSDLNALAARILGAHGKFSGFSYSSVNTGEPPKVMKTTEVRSKPFEASVVEALESIAGEDYEKIVLSRAIDATADKSFIPLETVNRLRERFPSCFCFSINNGEGQSFIGATPERLVGCRDEILETEALAGSAKRGSNAREDAQRAAELLSSDKDLREHRMVIESIRQRLSDLGIEPDIADFPQILKLANVQHLRTPIQARIPEGLHLLDVAKALHPTPAVGGRPRAKAVPQIASLEGFSRGLFAGLVGWFDMAGQGDLAVGIRSGLFSGNVARLYAGAGIVRGSDPDRERAETDMKLRALEEAIQ
ncbi:isochorismate synthase [Rubellicoccus peritrichatus]|uniref:isochorismate synthase n=1 Tax=Rubellicoccus peritrichatus TaxID=3080537 RepID=A0AAQ3QUT0_9BACT|nr:isochorismate synthase [Puniceicoccus sp. CR14]WOO40112.1 isochorismate synthase [Puniceicoccus sp. CR14]